ncbi:MAG: hypothetical protein ACR2L2_17700 [Acidobacteriota bacterium]
MNLETVVVPVESVNNVPYVLALNGIAFGKKHVDCVQNPKKQWEKKAAVDINMFSFWGRVIKARQAIEPGQLAC